MRASGTSLWLLPEPPAAATLARTIEALSARFGAPGFAPHLTLLGGLPHAAAEAVVVARRLAESARPRQARVARVGALPEFFRCLFLEIENEPWLLALHQRAVALAGPESPPPFFPHVSLLYAELAQDAKAALVSELSGSVPAAVRLDAIQVVRTEGEVGGWRPLAAFPLSRRD